MPQHAHAHLNGNLLCAIDIETTGLDFEKHDIYELAIIPMNSHLERDTTRKWLNLIIRPNRIKDIDWNGQVNIKNKGRVENAINTGLDSNTAMDILERWFDQLNLGTKKIAPVGQNYCFENKFLHMWLGQLNYSAKFNDSEIRDTMVIARFLNDMCDYRDEEKFMFPKVNLAYLASSLKVEHDYGIVHSALGDAATTADVYRRQVEELNKKMIFPSANYSA